MGTVPMGVWVLTSGDRQLCHHRLAPSWEVMLNPEDHSVASTWGHWRHRVGTATTATTAIGDREEGKESESPWLPLWPGCCYDNPNKAPAPSFLAQLCGSSAPLSIVSLSSLGDAPPASSWPWSGSGGLARAAAALGVSQGLCKLTHTFGTRLAANNCLLHL